LKKLQKWAKKAPMNFQHLVHLVEAEMARVGDREAEAIRLYNEAVSGARKEEYLQDEALANELAGRFYLGRELEHVAAAYLKSAHLCYARWGAVAKVHVLEAEYPMLLTREAKHATTTSGTLSKEALDFASILKASQAISGEIIFDELLRGLMKIAIENA